MTSGPGQRILAALDREFPSADRVKRLVRDNGFVKIGSGAFTSTWGKKRVPYVIKINEYPDPAAFKFYSMIARSQSKYFPKVHKLRTYVTAEGQFLFIAVVERLYGLTEETWAKANEDGRGFTSWIATLEESGITIVDYDYEEIAARWRRKNSNVVRIVNSVLKNTKEFADTDLFDGNMMVRLPTGDIVLNDPIFPKD